jgi:hypothetical protein
MSTKLWTMGAVAASATVLTVLQAPAAQAGAGAFNCMASGRSVTCAAVWGGDGGGLGRVITVPGPTTDEERNAQLERDRRWSARCQPSVRYDSYGVARYTYAAEGCEFGRLAD